AHHEPRGRHLADAAQPRRGDRGRQGRRGAHLAAARRRHRADPVSLERARAWVAQDPDPETREELAALIAGAEAGDEQAAAELEARFAGRLQFGTAGLRGALGAGPLRMNRVLVAQAAAG